MVTEAVFWLFGGTAALAGLFLPTLVALIRGSDRLFVTALANCSVFILGPLGTLLAVFVLAMPQNALDGYVGRWRATQQPRALRERNCPVCQEWISRAASVCVHCRAPVEPMEKLCPACRQPMPPSASTCLSCGYDQKA